jgi:hypothetical protein
MRTMKTRGRLMPHVVNGSAVPWLALTPAVHSCPSVTLLVER